MFVQLIFYLTSCLWMGFSRERKSYHCSQSDHWWYGPRYQKYEIFSPDYQVLKTKEDSSNRDLIMGVLLAILLTCYRFFCFAQCKILKTPSSSKAQNVTATLSLRTKIKLSFFSPKKWSLMKDMKNIVNVSLENLPAIYLCVKILVCKLQIWAKWKW